MKKSELITLLNSESGTLKVNKYCQLVRWQKDCYGNNVDRMQAIFSIQKYGDHITEIMSRNVPEIVEELMSAREIAFDKVAERMRNYANR